MFGAGGSSSTKFNRAQRLEKRSFKDIVAHYGESDKVILDKKLTPSQLDRFKIELQEKRRMERFKLGIALFVISFSVLSAFILILS